MTTYEEWRVTGRWGEDAFEEFWMDDGAEHDNAEGQARAFAKAMRENGHWTDGPHLHKRTVTVTDWTEVDA